MPYSPGQPWDPTLSYQPGQTCTYKGYPYIWYHPSVNSTAGTKPNVEEVLFYAGVDSRLERGWVMADKGSFISSPFGDKVTASYGDVKALQRKMRRIDPAADPDPFSPLNPRLTYEDDIYPGFWTPQDPALPANKTEQTRSFYGYNAMSVDYGLANNDVTPPVPATNGNPNVMSIPRTDFSYATEGPQPFVLNNGLSSVTVRTSPTTADIKIYATIQLNASFPYAPRYINQFGRDIDYTLTVINPGYPDQVINDTINTGSFRDGFSLIANSNVNTHSVTLNEADPYATPPVLPGYFNLVITDISPRFDD